MNLKILSFNWHEPYLCLLAKIGHEFLIVEPEVSPGNYRRWDVNMRPVPINVNLISLPIAKEMLEQGELDLIIAHNIKDLIEVKDYSLPKINVFHNCLTTEIQLSKNNIVRKEYLDKVGFLFKDVHKVFISEKKRQDWGFNGDVILPGLDVSEYDGYHGDKGTVLQVGNLLQERDLMMGYSTSKKIVGDHPLKILGKNPQIPGSCLSQGFQDLLENFRRSRVFLNTTVEEFEDGYNLSMLEAMAIGMPVISIWNKSSPIEDGINGYVSKDLKYLNGRIEFLLKNPEEAKKLGVKARKTVQDKFPLTRFLYSWRKAVEKSVLEFLQRTGINLDKKNLPFKDKNRGENEDGRVSTPDKPVSYYENIRNDLIPLIPNNASCILEVGCGSGMTGKELKKRYGAFVAGIELNASAANAAKDVLDNVVTGDIEKIDLPYNDNSFDCIIFADVLEHLVNPLSVLMKVRRLLKIGGIIVTSIPNVQFHGVIHNLIEGNWTYEKEGILDETHLRFFTYREIEKLFQKAGYSINKVEEVFDPQYEKLARNNSAALNFGRTQIKDLSPDEMRRFFVFQYLIKAESINVTNYEENDMFQKGETLFQVDNLLLEASKISEAGEHETAIKLYEEIISISPENISALIGIGNSYMKLQFPDKAEKFFELACLKEPNSSKAWQGLGLLALYREDIKKADISFNKSLDCDPENDKALCGLGMLRLNRDDLEGAVGYFCRSLNANPDNISACKFLLEISYKLEKFVDIEIHLKNYVDFHPGNINMLFGLAGVQYKLGKLEEAIKNLEYILVLDPEHESALTLFEIVKSDFVVTK